MLTSLGQRLEQYLRTDLRYLVRGSFWLLTGHGLQVASGIIMAIAFANLLPKSSYGTYQFIMAFVAILSACTLNMAIPIKRAVAQGESGALQAGFRAQLRWSIGIALIGVSLASYYFYNDNALLGKSFLAVAAFTPLIGCFSLYRSYLTGAQKFKDSALLGIWLRPILLVVMIGALFVTSDPFILVLTYLGVSTLTIGLLYWFTVHKYQLANIPYVGSLTFAKHVSILGIISVIGNHLEKLLIFNFLGATQVAVYVIALLPTTHAIKFFKIIGDLILPKFAQRDYGLLQKNMARKIGLVVVISLSLIVVYIVIAPVLYRTVFPTYPEAVLLSQLGILSLLARFGNLSTQAFNAHEMQTEQYIARLSTLGVKGVLLLTLIPTFGLLGAVWATIISNLFWSICSTMLFYWRRPAAETLSSS